MHMMQDMRATGQPLNDPKMLNSVNQAFMYLNMVNLGFWFPKSARKSGFRIIPISGLKKWINY